MKNTAKAITAALTCFMSLLLVGCGSESASKTPTKVPDGVVDVKIMNGHKSSDTRTYSIASHNYDKETKYDTVTVEWREDYPLMYDTWTETLVFKYYPDSDNWSTVGGHYSERTSQYKNEEIVNHYSGELKSSSPTRTLTYELDIADVDMENRTIKLKGTATAGKKKVDPYDIFNWWMEETDYIIDGVYELAPGAFWGTDYDGPGSENSDILCAVTESLVVAINRNKVAVYFPNRGY